MGILFLTIGIAVGVVIGWLFTMLVFKSKMIPKAEYDELNKNYQGSNVNLQYKDQKLDDIEKQLELKNNEIIKKDEELNSLKNDRSNLNANNKVLTEKYETLKNEIVGLQEKFKIEFENIASKILEEKSQKFTKQNLESMETILKPFRNNIDDFKKKVDEYYHNESKERFSLGKEVEKLVELNQKISEEANNLTNALKGSSKTQGDWGEMILENILVNSGLEKNREYFIQDYLKDEAGNNYLNSEGKKMRPDVIINFPDNRKVIIDSKVSLSAYTNYIKTEDLEKQKEDLAKHLLSIKKHIDELSNKKYQEYTPSLEFVIMFVPNEPAHYLALKNEPDLWKYAYDRKIILISPTNLIAILKIISALWKQEYQNRNVQEIVKRGVLLYEKFVGFVNDLNDIGTNIKKTQESYDNALSKLKSGRGNLIQQVEKLKELGIPSQKKLPQDPLNETILENTNEEESKSGDNGPE